MRSRVLVAVVCLLALAGHIAGGHAHADLLTSSLEAHEAGDGHHDNASSCDAVPAASVGSPVPPASSAAVSMVAATFVVQQRAVDLASLSAPTSPLFLLHAALLI